MGRINPLFCTTERSRRVSIGLMTMGLLSWVTWVGIASKGFSEIQDAGWFVFFGAPIVADAAAVAICHVHRSGSRTVRVLVSLNFMWVFLVGGWGYIWQWEYHFSFEQFIGLFIVPLIGSWLAFILWNWSKSAPVVTANKGNEFSDDQQMKNVQADIGQNENASSLPDRKKWRKPLYWAVGVLIIALGISQTSSTELLISFIFTWTVILIPPVIVRFVFVRKPILSMNIAAAISGGLYIFNLMLFIALGSQSKTHAVLVLGAIACYNILKYETKKQADARLLEERKRLGYD